MEATLKQKRFEFTPETVLYVMSSSRKCAGRLFQTRGPATAKLLSPNVLCVRGTAQDLSVEERTYVVGKVRSCVARQRGEDKTC